MSDVTASARADTAPMVAAAVLRGPARPDLLRDEALGDLFRATARANPDKPALVGDARTLTYAELEAEAGAIAAGLAARGVGPGDVVGLWMGRGVDVLVAQLGIALSGAAWLPFDADAPAERVGVCLRDAGAKALLTAPDWTDKAQGTGVLTLTPADLMAVRGAAPTAAPAPEQPAYLIYTSGSTGTPKGIVITHRNICHFLRAGNDLYGFRAEDIVLQGASVAFDLSMEEIWIPYLVGATLVVAPPALMGETDKLAALLRERRVTVLDTVPTLLAMLPPDDLPDVRLVLLGGEALPAPLAIRWATPGRRLLNTYGPTEATVVATVDEVDPLRPVTIGTPIANYSAYVVAEDGSLVGEGVDGELLIGGPGVAQGYLARPDLTAEKFIPNPYASDGSDPVLYRSGDAVSLDAAGRLRFHGRIDDQVKVRGFRVELGEIEAKLAELPGVSRAAVVLRRDDGLDRLVAFLVPAPGEPLDRMAVRTALRDRLPTYMIPARFEVMDGLPVMTSGKVDRKRLQAAELGHEDAGGEVEEPRTPVEASLLEAARRAFGSNALPLEADFFTDLGGHSLIAARFVGFVRETPELAGITLQDVYGARTLRAMAERLEARGAGKVQDLSFEPVPLRRRFWCGLAQAAAMPFVLGLMTAQWLGVFISYMLLSGENASWWQEIATLMWFYLFINLVTTAIAVAGKWLILGRTKPGRYPLWGTYYFRWWLVQRLNVAVHVKWLQGSPLMNLYLRALGAKVGRDAYVSDAEFGAVDLVTIGAGAVIGSKAKIANAEVIGNELVIGTVDIGAESLVGTSAVLAHDVRVGEGAEVLDLTSVGAGVGVGAWEVWDGSPARKTGMVDRAALPARAEAGPGRRALVACGMALMTLVVPPLGLMPIVPAFSIFDRLDDVVGNVMPVSSYAYLPLIAWPTAMALVAVTVLLIAAVRWTVLPVVRAGRYSIFSGFYFRKWVVALATEVTLETLSSLYATVYMRGWYRLMGARIGKGAEISTNLAGRYDLVDIGEKCFIADEVVLGDEDVRRGWMTLEPVKTEARVFVGNDAVVPPGTTIREGALLGIKSKPPAVEMGAGETWFGSPPIKLPRRQTFGDVGAAWTYEPSFRAKFGRAVFEAFHLSLPTALFITFGTIAVDYLEPWITERDFVGLFPRFLMVSVLISVAMMLMVCAIKWLLMGRYAPTVKPMWSFWAMRTEAVAVMYWGLAGKVLLDQLRGTPFLPWIWRLFGVKVGEGVYLDTTDVTEFDCVTIGDHCSVNAIAALQTHLYEDRVMKVGRVKLGRGVTVGAGSTVLYDTHVGDFARLGPLTLVMKGESIPANSSWAGAPAEPVLLAEPTHGARPMLAAAE